VQHVKRKASPYVKAISVGWVEARCADTHRSTRSFL
jgi:hypothetical protein